MPVPLFLISCPFISTLFLINTYSIYLVHCALENDIHSKMKLKTNLPIYISTPLIFTLVSLFLFTLIPVIGALLFLPLIPFANVYDSVIPGDFSKSGVHVEIGFAWITLKTWQAWLFYGSFFFMSV